MMRGFASHTVMPAKCATSPDEAPVVVDRVVDLEPGAPAGLVVLLAVARRDVHEPGARVHRHEVRPEHRHVPVDPRMAGGQPHQCASGHRQGQERAAALDPRQAQERLRQRLRDHEGLALQLDRGVGRLRVHRDGEVRGQRPRGRGPDHERDRTAPEGGQRGRGALERELHVDRRSGLVLVLDLGLGQGGLAVHAPVHRLQALVHQVAPHEAPELARDRRLVGGRHRAVRVLPVTEDPETTELSPLDVDELGRVLATAPPLLERIHRLAHVDRRLVESQLHVHLVLDGQPVAVPARHVDRVVPEHRAGLDDQVLQDLVERGPHVDVAVGVRRPVVQDPAGAARRGLPDPPVDVHRLPSARATRARAWGRLAFIGKAVFGRFSVSL